MAIQFKQKCKRCNINFVLVGARSRYIVCEECQKKEMSGEISDPEMKKLFDVPEELYLSTPFLRNIKVNYLKYGSLSENQINAFRNVVIDVKKKREDEKKQQKIKDAEEKQKAKEEAKDKKAAKK